MIRSALLADVPRLVEMGTHFLRASPYAAHIAENAQQMDALATQMVTTDGMTVLVAETDRIVGMLGLVASPNFLSGELTAGEVFWWMEPDARGAGVRLLKAGEQWARDRGAVSLQMIAPDAHVEQFYQRVGYVPIERTFIRRLHVA